MTQIEHFARKLKALRALRDLPQAELCEQTGIRRSILINYEKGRSFPGAADLAKLQLALGVRFDDKTQQAFETLAPDLSEPEAG